MKVELTEEEVASALAEWVSIKYGLPGKRCVSVRMSYGPKDGQEAMTSVTITSIPMAECPGDHEHSGKVNERSP